MDVFGTLASTIDLVKVVVSYIQAIKDSKKDRRELLSEVSALGDLLEDLYRRLSSTDTDGGDDGTRLLKTGIKGHLDQCCEILQSIAKELERVASSTNTGKSASFLEKMKSITWPFRQEDIRTMLGKMERLKSLILLALQSSLMKFTEETREELGGVGRNIDGIKAAVSALEIAHMNGTESLRVDIRALASNSQSSANSIVNIENTVGMMSKSQQDQTTKEDQIQANLAVIRESMYNQELQDILKWLSQLDFSEKQNTIFEKCAPDTGRWFLEHPKFLAWRRGEYQTLWCPGNPGVGKSVMASLVIDELRTTATENSDTALAFIYLEYKMKYTMTQLAETILKQLVQRRRTQTGLESLRKHMRGSRPTSKELLDILKAEVETYARVFVVIDALDETDIEVWVPLFEHLQVLSGISLFATSRDIHEIALELQQCQSLGITANEGDIRKYIEGRLESSTKFKRLLERRPSVHEEIVIGILTKADGMFLLARLHMNSLETKLRVRDLRRALDELPNTLDDTYDEAMSRIGNDHKALAYQIISWLIHAAQPMTIRDLQYALAVEDGMTALDVDDLHDEVALTSICVGLVVLQEYTAAGPHASRKVVGLVHYTTQEYFLHSPNYSAQFADSAHFATTCLRYLALDIFKADPPLDDEDSTQEQLVEIPFSRYAMLSWGVHARTHWDDKAVRDLAMGLLHDSNRVATVGSLPCHCTKNFSAIHLCARFGLKDYLESLLDDGCDVDSKDSDGNTVVSYAIMHSQEGIMQLLLARGDVDVNSKDGGTTLLAQAIIRGYEEIVRLLLLRSDLDVNSWRDQGGDGILSFAIFWGRKTIVRLLLTKDDLDVNRCGGSRTTPIIVAVRGGDSGIVELLLARDDLDVNSQDYDGDTPLACALVFGHETIVQLLLARNDLDVNQCNQWGVTPIIEAIRGRNYNIVKLLLARGDLDINLQDRHGVTPLSSVVDYGHDEAILQLLLTRNDLDVNQRDSFGRTPIINAAWSGRGGIVELLLTRDDLDVNVRCQEGDTPLLSAVFCGHEAIVWLLLARNDLDVNRRGSFGSTPIVHAVLNGYKDIVELLLAHDSVDINLQGCTPLLAAIRRGYEATIRLLLARADLDTSWKSNAGDTYLAIAAHRNNEEVARWFLANGNIDVNSKNLRGQGPLTLAASEGCNATVKLLLNQDGIDVNLVDSDGKTPLDHAIQGHHEDTIELLRAVGGHTGRELGVEPGGGGDSKEENEEEEDSEEGRGEGSR